MGDDTNKIRAAIDDARTQVGDTLEALSFKTDIPARASEAFSHTVDAVKSSVGEASETVKQTVGEATETVKKTVGEASETVKHTVGEVTENVKSTVGQVTENVKSNLDDVSGQARDFVKDASATVGKKVGETTELLSATAKDAAQSAKAVSQDVTHKAGEIADAGREQLDKAKEYAEFNFSVQLERITDFTRGNPVGALAIAIGAGFVIGRLTASKSR